MRIDLKKSGRFFLQSAMLTACLLAGLWAPAAWSGGIGDWFNDTLIDPQDGMLDASDYLASASGFLPIPIIITEPAVGFGLGAAVAYFHARGPEDTSIYLTVGSAWAF